MRYRPTFAPTADQSFGTLPARIQREFDRAFEPLTEDPTGSRAGLDAHQLYGYRNVWTLRIRLFRGVYVVDGHELVWIVFGPRETVYAQLHALLPPDRRYVSRDRLIRR
jgi:mRNA-degrading endonuclease RelE of RelBE toxin-antitoxin system